MNTNISTYSAEDKRKAAYALNLCTVSVSQVTDYDDLYIMEQEYDTILNNLNLQNYIKDDSLLSILKNILDTINYFRISDAQKKMIEKEYQHKMKNALWSAVPNFGVLLTGGHPAQWALSLATQVGLGYMNYRKNKNQYGLDKEKQELQLNENLMIQLHALRVNLFEAAWSLSDKYDFSDALRLSAKQLANYNEILIDSDPLRRFERLEAISDSYHAFPPFWYHKGNAAREVIMLDDYKSMHEHFNAKALEAYQRFDEIYTPFMREDLIAASCALEHISLLDYQQDAQKISCLLKRAVSLAGNNFDVLQMCVIIYSYLGELADAERILRRLTNENYNLGINGMLLSRLYCRDGRRVDYDILLNRVDDEANILPWFKTEEEANEAEKVIREMAEGRVNRDRKVGDGWGKNTTTQQQPFEKADDPKAEKGKSTFEQKIESEFERQKKALQKPNLMVVGGTGAGKSSLINRIFGKDVAPVGAGMPVTRGIRKYETDVYPVIFWDTEGYEVASNGTKNKTNFDNVIKPKIDEMNTGELREKIHLVWYCIPISSHRVTDYDRDNIRWFKQRNMRVAIVFTKCDSDKELPNGRGKEATEFKDVIDGEIPGLNYFETCAEKKDVLLDLEDLLDWSVEALPNDQMRESFISAQKISVRSKRKIAQGIVAAATATTAATAGLNPLPIADTILIVPQQLAMAVSLSKVFMFDSIMETAGNILKTQLASLAGKALVASFLKFIPIVGQIANAAVAAAITYGLGMALTETYASAYVQYLETGEIPDWSAIFSSDIFVKNIVSFFNDYKNKN